MILPERRSLSIEAIKTAQIIDIDSKTILNHIGYEGDYEPSARIKHLVDDYIENYHNLVESTYSYTFRNIESVDGNRVYLSESIILESRVISRLCKKCDKLAVFILTIGDHLEEVDLDTKLDYQQALILAMKAEKNADRLYNDLAGAADDENLKGMFLTLAQEEAKHKLRFEVEYDEYVLREN